MGFKVGTKITAEANIFVVKASIEATFDASYEHTWGSGKTETKTYAYNLKRGDRCTPSMVHLDLECDALVDTVYWDTTWWGKFRQYTRAWTWERTGGAVPPYHSWCRDGSIRQDILKQNKYWSPILEEDPDRGSAWLRSSSELNEYRTNLSEPLITNEQIVIRNDWDLKKYQSKSNNVWVCNRFLGSTKEKTMSTPLVGDSGSLLGYIA